MLLGYMESHSSFLPNRQMVNTRNSQCNGQPNNNNNNHNNNNAHLEQLLTTQNQLMQAMLQTLNNMKPNQQQGPPPPPPHQSHLAEFLRTRPTTLSQAKDPMDAEDWLKGVEKKLVITQCTDHEKVLLLHTNSMAQLPTGGRRTAIPMRTSTPSPGMSSRLISALTMCLVAP
jgi:hypothetical protein